MENILVPSQLEGIEVKVGDIMGAFNAKGMEGILSYDTVKEHWFLLTNYSGLDGTISYQCIKRYKGYYKYSWSLGPDILVAIGKKEIILDENKLKLLKTRKETFSMSLANKIKQLTRREPQKSFINQGVTEENGLLTAEGRDTFVQWLFDTKSYQDAFYKEVIQPIVEENKK